MKWLGPLAPHSLATDGVCVLFVCTFFFFARAYFFCAGWYNPYRTCCDSSLEPVPCVPSEDLCYDVHRANNGTCVATPNSGPCRTSENSCTEDFCVFGVCTAGQQKKCDDDNVCTKDYCEDGVCKHVSTLLPCDDKDACTLQDVCSPTGVCQGTPKNCRYVFASGTFLSLVVMEIVVPKTRVILNPENVYIRGEL